MIVFVKLPSSSHVCEGERWRKTNGNNVINNNGYDWMRIVGQVLG